MLRSIAALIGGGGGAPQDPPQREGEEKTDTFATTHSSPPSQQSSTKKSPRSNTNRSKRSLKNDDDNEDLAKTPLCICPWCNKVLASMKSLYGHYGRSHRASINQDKIKFACPFCDDDDVMEFQVFGTTAELESHIDESHPECTLLTSLTETASNASASAAKMRSDTSPKQKPSSQPQSSDSVPAMATPARKRKRRSSRNQAESNDPSSNGSEASDKPPKQQYKHPLCKCPLCVKILPPQGLFGHFGRVHSGQLGGQTSRFEWANVEYGCPFCPEESPPTIFRTIELVESHVGANHPHCHLTRPNALNKSGGAGAVSRSSSKPDAAGPSSANAPTRKSQRSRRSYHDEPEEEEKEEEEDDDGSVASSPAGATRKSQRSRRPAQNGPMISEDIKRGGATEAARQQRVAAEEDEGKTLYACPDCDKKNLTKHGLHAHYGMVHGGRVDMGRVAVVASPKIKKERAPAVTSRTGPWTEDEHAAFLEGHARYGNRWKRISVEYVPTRDAKQIGSHALNYFTTRGEWKPDGRNRGGDAGRPAGDSDGSAASSNGNKDKRRSKRENSGKKPRHSLIGNVVVSNAPTDMEASDEEEQESVDGSAGSNADAGAKGDEDVDDDDREEATAAAAPADNDDGNSSHCIVCFEGGNIVCCSRCPRAYHPRCLAKDGHGNINVDLLPNDWRCNRCKRDSLIGTGEEISQKYHFGNKKIRSAYAEFKDCSDYNYCCALLSNILDILNKLKSYDYGYVFSEPVDVDDVPDYLEVVNTPMDYGTVVERLEGGNYVDLIASDDVSRDDENSTMEEILLHVLCDIERVHHNCQLFNKKDSSIFRIGGVHASKWTAYFGQYILDRLPENVQRDLTLFRHRCEIELKNENHAERELKAEKREAKKREAKKKEKEKAASTPSKSPSTSQKKRKASEPPGEKDAEEAVDGVDADVDEDQRKPKAKKARQEENTSHSSALLLTEEQMRSLENVFFSSANTLQEESDELDACSALTSLLVCTPTNGKCDDKAGNPDVSGGIGGGGGALTCVRSELSLHGLDQHPEAPSSGATPSAMVPEIITSGPTLEPPPVIAKMSTCSSTTGVDIIDMDKVSMTANNNASTAQGKGEGQGTTFQRQWYERLNELKKYKVAHGTAVVSATSNDKLYHWRLRQRKRYHLTLFRMPHLKRDSPAWDENGVDKNGKQWLLAIPEMKGVFSLSESPDVGGGADSAPKPFTIKDKDVALDEKTVDAIAKKHRQQLYCPLPPNYTLASRHSSRHSNSLFWDESLEELRFFQGENQHTLVPRDFPHNSFLAIWVEKQRAKYLLQSVGLFSGLTGWQMLVLDELNLCDLSSLPTVDAILMNGGAPTGSTPKTPPKGGENKKGGKNKTKQESNSPERKNWSTHANDFKEWFQKLPLEDKQRASELLPRANWPLYSWCWRQCNASSALLCMTPNISGINMSVKKLSTLASAGFFRAFPYNDRNAGLVCEDDYESCEAFDSTFRVLENFSIKYGTTHVPDWYDCDRAFRMWVSALTNGLSNFVKGEPCVLSARQIEKLILIGFCNDRDELPNLSKGDVVWLKMLVELKRHQGLFGVCSVSSNFPVLHRWVAEQKELFRLSRMGNKDMMKSSRLQMLMEAGVDFFTGECLPDTANDFKEFEKLTSSPAETFPAKDSAQNNHTDYGWNFEFQYDNYWNHYDCRARFKQMKARNGHSLILASDDNDVYWWFVENRGKMLLAEINDPEFSKGPGSRVFSHSILNFITAHQEGEGARSDGDKMEIDQSMFLWLHYCERLMMFKARKGHCKIPKDYPDKPLLRWLARQQELIHSYSTNQPTDILPVQLKILHALGLHGSKRYGTPPKLSSRTLKRKYPSKKDKKRDSDKDKSRNE